MQTVKKPERKKWGIPNFHGEWETARKPFLKLIHKRDERLAFRKGGNTQESIKPDQRPDVCRGTKRPAHRKRAVIKVDRNGEVMERYESIREAAEASYTSPQVITRHCQGKAKDPFAMGNFTYRYEDGN